MNLQVPRNIGSDEASGMTVNERLYVSGLMEEYDKAVEIRDVEGISRILSKLFIDQTGIEAIIEFEFRKK